MKLLTIVFINIIIYRGFIIMTNTKLLINGFIIFQFIIELLTIHNLIIM